MNYQKIILSALLISLSLPLCAGQKYLKTSSSHLQLADPRNNIPACGKKSYAYVHKEGIYSKDSKFQQLSDAQKHEICRSHDYKTPVKI